MKYYTSNQLEESIFQEKKLLSSKIEPKYFYTNPKYGSRINQCGNFLMFNHQREKTNHLNTRKVLASADFCKLRLCPMCNFRRSRKSSIQNYKATLLALEKNPNLKFILLTLTVKNPNLIDTRTTIKAMTTAFNKLFFYKEISDISLGYIRALEVHPQKNDNNKTHPHFHVLIAVDKSYFYPKNNNYLSAYTWRTLWQKAMKLDYVASVDIRTMVNKSNPKDSLAYMVFEVSKYLAKDTDLLKLTNEQFKEFSNQLQRLRSLSYSGIIKECRSLLKLENPETGNLIHELLPDSVQWETFEQLYYSYFQKKYTLDYTMSNSTSIT